MGMDGVVEQLKSLLVSARSSFGKYAAKVTLAYIAEENVLKELTEQEVYAIREHKKWMKDFPRIQRLWPLTLSANDTHCPHCMKKVWGNTKIVTVLKETADIDLVTVACKCGTVFRKYEDKREV
jgi:RNase P subunit RPR2